MRLSHDVTRRPEWELERANDSVILWGVHLPSKVVSHPTVGSSSLGTKVGRSRLVLVRSGWEVS